MQGFCAKKGSGDAMNGLRGADVNSWTYPWIAKTVGAVSAVVHQIVYKEREAHPRVVLVLLNAAMETGSQSEWEALDTVKDWFHSSLLTK